MHAQEAEEVAKKQAAEKGDGKGGKGGKGGGSKPGKKGKETPAADADPAIPLPEKPPTSMRKRGEEDLDSKYIGEGSLTYILTLYMYIQSRYVVYVFLPVVCVHMYCR